LLPVKPQGYYREFVHPTPGVNGSGAMRVVKQDKVGKCGLPQIIINHSYQLDNPMERVSFIDNPETYFNNGKFLAFLPKTNREDELHIKLNEALRFPDYYGENWNALYDCLRDFSWIDKKGIALVHTTLPNLSDEELRTYIEIIFDASQDWKDGEEHYFKVIFPKETEEVINNIRP